MPTPNKDLVQQVLAIDGRDILCRQAVELGWKAVQAKHTDVAWWRRKSTRAHVMWENTVDQAISLLDGKRGVKHVPHHDTASFIFDGLVLARFKVAKVSLLTSNYPTFLARLFDHHQADLFGFDGHHRVEVVHVLNRFGTALEWIGVVAREHRKILWQYELPSGGAIPQPLPLPSPSPRPAADRVLRPVKPEEKDADKESE